MFSSRVPLLCITLCLCLAANAQQWVLQDEFSGATFFDSFDFYDQYDPTHGFVSYLSQSVAQSLGHLKVSNGVVYIFSDNTTMNPTSGRASVRISSQNMYNGGLFVFDVAHMPFGCGTWPSLWTVGPNWPYDGEINLLEGININTQNRLTIHTAEGCTMNNVTRVETGTSLSTNCDGYLVGNEGCAVSDSRSVAYGAVYNQNGGGVHVMSWTAEAIQIWFFTRSAIPADITAGNPNPSGWGTPVADFPLTGNCSASFFSNHQITLDNTFCGDWAGSPQYFTPTCSPNNCTYYVATNPGAFSESYWAINSFKVYQPNPATGTTGTPYPTPKPTPAPTSTTTSGNSSNVNAAGFVSVSIWAMIVAAVGSFLLVL